jgi:hypothetical protein
MNKIVGIVVAVAIVVGAAAFWGGMTYAKSNPPTGGAARGQGQFGQGAGRGNRGGNGGAFGKIISKDATSITVELTGGPNATSTNGTSSGSKIVLYNTSTEVAKTVTGSANDLTVGTNVVVSGTSNSDGSITAQMIQIRPAMSQRPAGLGN